MEATAAFIQLDCFLFPPVVAVNHRKPCRPLANGSLLWQAGLLLRALPPSPAPFGSTLDVCLMFLPFCTDLFIKRNKRRVEAEPSRRLP